MSKPKQLSFDLSGKTTKDRGLHVASKRPESEVRSLNDKRREKIQRSDSVHINAILKLTSHFK